MSFMRSSIRGCGMTDVVIAPARAAGRSRWADAWGRLKANRMAVASAIYIILMALVCVFGPYLTAHQFSTIYQDYVRVPPSFSPYPKPDMIDQAVKDVVSRARVALTEWHEEGDRIFVTVASAKPIDERVTRYLDRSSVFQDGKLERKSADGLQLTMSAEIKYLYFFFGTDNNGRDLLTRTLIAGRVSLAIGLLAGIVAVVIGVLYGASSGFLGGKTDEVMMRIVDIL